MTKKIVVWGASGHAKVVADILRLNHEYEIVGFLDDANPSRRGESFCGALILGNQEELEKLKRDGVQESIIAVGDCTMRMKLAALAQEKKFRLATAVHPKAIVAGDVFIGPGTVIAAGAVVNPGTRIGSNVIINTSASVDHDCALSDGVHISPGAHLGGQVSVGEGTWIGIGATVIDHITIGAKSLVGAGAVVVRNVPSAVVAYGVPATVIRSLSPIHAK